MARVARKKPSQPRRAPDVVHFSRIDPEEWDGKVADLLKHLARVDNEGMLGMVWREYDDPLQMKALALARAAILCMWGPRSEAGGYGDYAQRVETIEAMYRDLVGRDVVQASSIIRVFADDVRRAATPETKDAAAAECLRLLARLQLDAGDLDAMRSSSEQLREVAGWLSMQTDGASKRGKALQAHAILARIVEASHGRPTDSESIEPVLSDYSKQMRKWREHKTKR